MISCGFEEFHRIYSDFMGFIVISWNLKGSNGKIYANFMGFVVLFGGLIRIL